MKQQQLEISTQGFSEVHNLDPHIETFLDNLPWADGVLLVTVPGSTAGVTTLEFEPGCVKDLRRALEQIAPRDQSYEHNKRWGDGNGFSHLRSALLGPSVSLPFSNRTLQTGTWQQVVLVDNDNRPRERTVTLTALPA